MIVAANSAYLLSGGLCGLGLLLIFGLYRCERWSHGAAGAVRDRGQVVEARPGWASSVMDVAAAQIRTTSSTVAGRMWNSTEDMVNAGRDYLICSPLGGLCAHICV